jgi:hypothetical protein
MTDHDALSGMVGLFILFLGICTVIGGLAATYRLFYPRKTPSYHHVTSEEDGRLEETHRWATVPE